MAFDMAPRKSISNNPDGRKPDKLISDAIRLALHREAQDARGRPTKKLALIADQLVNKAVDGDMAAIREVIDRIEGRPMQTTDNTHKGAEGPIVISVDTGISVREPVDEG